MFGADGLITPITMSTEDFTVPQVQCLDGFAEVQAETLAAALRDTGVRVFLISPGLVRTEMTERFGDDAPWTPPELAPQLIRVLASGRADELAGRYLHAEHDDVEDLIGRADEIAADDLNAIRLRR